MITDFLFPRNRGKSQPLNPGPSSVGAITYADGVNWNPIGDGVSHWIRWTGSKWIPIEPNSTNITFNSGDFTGNGAMTWTVVIGNVFAWNAATFGNLVWLAFYLNGTTVGGTANTQLLMKIPFGKTAKGTSVGTFNWIQNGVAGVGFCQASAGATQIQLFTNFNAANWALSAGASNFAGTLVFDVQ